jgi:hypothetical protein
VHHQCLPSLSASGLSFAVQRFNRIEPVVIQTQGVMVWRELSAPPLIPLGLALPLQRRSVQILEGNGCVGPRCCTSGSGSISSSEVWLIIYSWFVKTVCQILGMSPSRPDPHHMSGVRRYRASKDYMCINRLVVDYNVFVCKVHGSNSYNTIFIV